MTKTNAVLFGIAAWLLTIFVAWSLAQGQMVDVHSSATPVPSPLKWSEWRNDMFYLTADQVRMTSWQDLHVQDLRLRFYFSREPIIEKKGEEWVIKFKP